MMTTMKMSLSMYRNHPVTSPLFDIPDFPTLRRVKPLPRRRQPSSTNSNANSIQHVLEEDPSQSMSFPLSVPGPDATAEELLAHADMLSSHMAMQGYYLPILGGVQELFRGVAAAASGAPGASAALETTIANSAYALGLAGALAPGGGANTSPGEPAAEEDNLGDGSYIDHLQQPGNTKKRKVPANASTGAHGHHLGGLDGSGDEEDSSLSEGRERSFGHAGADSSEGAHESLELDAEPTPGAAPAVSRTGTFKPRKGRMSNVTLAGIKHKETLKVRKRQLATVLGALSHGDTLALDQALSANYPFAAAAASSSGTGGAYGELKASDVPKIRLSKRKVPRLARLAKHALKFRHPDKIGLEVADFTFDCPSETADRLIATKEEVTMLRSRFEAELARQAAKAAKAAASNKGSGTKGSRKKRGGDGDRTQPRARTSAPSANENQPATFLDQGLGSMSAAKPRTGKKKKRSALANASNPHHLRNYVPSRLPHSTSGSNNQAHMNQGNPNSVGPLPLRFLSAEIPPRRRKRSQVIQPTSQLTNPAEEWICAFCEYELFYGDEQDYRRAIRNRKKILRRRRRAQERAAAAASGNSTLKKGGSRDDEEENDDPGYDPSIDELAALPKQSKWKGDPNKDREQESAYG